MQQQELTVQQWFERGFAAVDFDEKLRFYSEAIRLKPDYATAFYNRGNARGKPDDAAAFGCAAEFIQKFLGHTSITTTMDTSGRRRSQEK